MIRLQGKFTVKTEERERFMEALLANKKGVEEKEPGFLEMSLFVDKNDPNVIFAYEVLEDTVALDFHREQTHTQNLMKVAETALACPPDIHFLGDTAPEPIAMKQINPEDDVFTIFFIFKIKEGYREKLIERFETHVNESRKEEACLLFDFYTIEGKDNYLFVYEYWRKESDVWDIHMKTPHSVLTGALMKEAIDGDMKQYMSFVKKLK